MSAALTATAAAPLSEATAAAPDEPHAQPQPALPELTERRRADRRKPTSFEDRLEVSRQLTRTETTRVAHSNIAWEVVHAVRFDPILGQVRDEDLARLMPQIEVVKIADQAIFQYGEPAAALYFILAGNVSVSNGARNQNQPHPAHQSEPGLLVHHHYLGEETVLGGKEYRDTAYAVGEVKLLKFAKETIAPLLKSNPKLSGQFFDSYLTRTRNDWNGEAEVAPGSIAEPLREEPLGSNATSTSPIESNPLKSVDYGRTQARAGSDHWRELIGWALCVLLPPFVIWGSGDSGLSEPARIFLGVFTATVLMWVFRLVADFIPGLFVVTGTVIFGLVPSATVLSGFASDGFFMSLSILGVAAVIVSSGLSYRVLLLVINALPGGRAFGNLGLFLTGLALSPVVPSINGRVALTTPLLLDMIETMGFKAGGRAATQLAFACFSGITLLSAVFLTSKSINFVVFGLLPGYAQDQYQWFGWFLASAAVGGILILACAILWLVLFPTTEGGAVGKDMLEGQLDLLGPMKPQEWAGAIGVIVFVILILTQTLHKISPPWIGLFLLFFLLAFNYLKGSEFKDKIDWPFLMYLAGITGMVAAMNYLGISAWLSGKLGFLGAPMSDNFPLFVGLLVGVLSMMRLFAPINAVVAIAATVLMPLADIHGVSPWVVGFIILTVGELWWLPYQCSYYLQFQELTKKRRLYDETHFLIANAALNVVKIGALYAALPLWKKAGLL